jgi:SAM-dependent methyltransferase
MMRAAFYAEDLALIHHLGCKGYSMGAAPWLLKASRGAGNRRGTLLDLGCGSGWWAREASRAGHEVIGVDISQAMIRLAKRIAPRAQFYCLPLAKFRIPKCEIVTAVGEVFNYLDTSSPRRPDLRSLFCRIGRALRPGGMLIFDMILTEGEPMNYRTWQSSRDWATLVEVHENRRNNTLVREITSFRKRGRAWRRREETHLLWLPARSQVRKWLLEAGFSVRSVKSYGTFRLPIRRWAFIAKARPSPATGKIIR